MASVGSSLSFSTIDDETMRVGQLKKNMSHGRTLGRPKKSKNKTRKKSSRVSSMLDYMNNAQSGQQLEENFAMLQPHMSTNAPPPHQQPPQHQHPQEEDDTSDSEESTQQPFGKGMDDEDDDEEVPSFLRKQKKTQSHMEGFDTRNAGNTGNPRTPGTGRNSQNAQRGVRPLLDDSQSMDPIQFYDAQRHAELVKEYGEEMLMPWASENGPGRESAQRRRAKLYQQAQQVQQRQGQGQASREGFSGFSGGSVPYVGDMNGEVPKDAVLEKMNYMIHLLEDQQDQRTESVNEELILYLFLGIFVIFVTDSFTRVGRYRR